MGASGSEYITRDGAVILVRDLLDRYEEEKVEPRDRANRESLQEIKDLIQQGRGALMLASAIMGVASFFWLVSQIVHAMGKH